mmetsp:Transcript_38762/g.51077  ORF Transcript_38762/g.51077 Transcript_38762/m.51077 type:complete len:102 (+) Transcript_38762:128-433(+)
MVDYKGQELAEQIYYYLVIIVGAIAWVVGYVKESFLLTVYGWAGGVALAVLICVPNWPWFNRHPIKWLEEIPASGSSKKKSENSETKKKKKKKDKEKEKDN